MRELSRTWAVDQAMSIVKAVTVLAEVHPIPEKRTSRSGIADADLVEDVKTGDRWAFDALYRRYAGAIGGMATRLLASRQDADDVVHDTFLKAFQKLHTLRDPARFRSWLFSIAVSEARMLLRKRKVRSIVGYHLIEDATLEMLASRDCDGETRVELAALDALLRTMPTEDRIAWVLRHVEGQSLEETAKHCGCSLATIKRRLRAAADRVKRHMEDR